MLKCCAHFYLLYRFTYQHLVGAYSNAGNIEKVKEIMAEIEEKNLRVNDTTYNYCVRCYLKIG